MTMSKAIVSSLTSSLAPALLTSTVAARMCMSSNLTGITL